jgi:transposase InsO family protein
MGASPNTDLVIDALLMAFKPPPGPTGALSITRIAAVSTPRRPSAGDQPTWGSPRRSAPPVMPSTTPAVKALRATLKREPAWIHARTTWPTRGLLRSALFDYIEGFFNPSRIQERPGHQDPADYERADAAA